MGFIPGMFGFGFAVLSMGIGGLIGNFLDPPDAPDPPPLGDLGIK